jgi:ankyrin repeat protein
VTNHQNAPLSLSRWLPLITTLGLLALIAPTHAILAQLLEDSDDARLERLIKAGLPLDTTVHYNSVEEPLIVAACVLSKPKLVAVLLNAGAPVTTKSKHDNSGDTLVAIAANRRDGELIELLAQYGADREGNTPLITAIMRRDLNAAQAALDSGADINARNRFDQSALDYSHPSRECFAWLVKHGAGKHFSKLNTLCILDPKAALLELATGQYSAQVKARALEWAIRYERTELVEALCSPDVEQAFEARFHFEPTAYAVINNSSAALTSMIRLGKPVETSKIGLSHLRIAVSHDSFECLEVLLRHVKNRNLE